MMTTIHKNLNNNKLEAYIKGACEVILIRCTKILVDSKSLALYDEMKNEIMAANDEMAKKGLRVLALAYKEAAKLVICHKKILKIISCF